MGWILFKESCKMLLTSGWEAAGGEFFLQCSKGGKLHWVLKVLKWIGRGEDVGINCYPFVSKDTHFFQHKYLFFRALCMILSVRDWVIYEWKHLVRRKSGGWFSILIEIQLELRKWFVFQSPSLCLVRATQLISRHHAEYVLLLTVCYLCA